MTQDLLPQSLTDASLLLALVGGSGQLLWSNSAWKRFMAQNRADASNSDSVGSNLSQVFPEEYIRWIRLIESSGSRIVSTLTIEGRFSQELSLTVIDLSSDDPDSELKLLALSRQPSRSEGVTQREEFLMTVAHDLKNPIGAIFGYADVMLDTSIGQGLNEKQRDILFRIRSTATRSLDLVRNYQHLGMLDQRLFSHALPISAPPVDLSQLCKFVVESTWREDFAAHQLKLLLSDSPLYIQAERSDLERVVSNLFGNALKFTPAGGEITMRCTREGEFAVLSVHNSGSHIQPSEHSKIFEAYGRGSNIGESSGSGLGLYIVHKIVGMLGGRVEIESSVEQGTKFIIRLRIVDAAKV